MLPAPAAVAAHAAEEMAFTSHPVTHPDIGHPRSCFLHITHILMSDCHRHLNGSLRPLIPFVDMQIGTADSRLFNLYDDIVVSRFRDRHLLHPKSLRSLSLNKSLHFIHN